MEKNILQFKEGRLKNQNDFKSQVKKKYNESQKKTREIKEEAEIKLRQLKAGKVPWSPKYQKIVDTIKFWRQVNKWKKGFNTSRQIMKRLAIKLEIHWTQVRLCTSKEAEKNGLKLRKTITNKKVNLINCEKNFNSLTLMLWLKKHMCQRW